MLPVSMYPDITDKQVATQNDSQAAVTHFPILSTSYYSV